MPKHTKVILLAIVIAVTGSVAYAAKDNQENDAAAVTHAGIPLSQAVSMAERYVNGQASRAEFESTKQGGVYDVEVVSGAKVFDVRIDAAKGNIIDSSEDKTDQDNGGDPED